MGRNRCVTIRLALAALAVALALRCGSSSSPKNPTFSRNIAVPNVSSAAATNFGFDIGGVTGNTYFVTDRNNKAVDLVDTGTLGLTQVQGSGASAFHGVDPGGNAKSGPDGANAVGNLLYVGDVNSVKIVDPAAKTIVKTIPIGGTSGFRADEGCVDAGHHLFMISSPEETPPFATFIDTSTQSVVATVQFIDNKGAPTAGLEACGYDSANDTFYVNNDGTTDNPHGELVALPGAAVRAIAPGATVNYLALQGAVGHPEGDCDPTGLALGPGTDVAVGCREATTGSPLLLQIMNRRTGQIMASLKAGGGDQLAYDQGTNRYYNAASRWTASGNAATNGNCSAASLCTPRLFVIDAGSRTIVTQVPTGNNSHSIAVDSSTGRIFVPYSSAAAPAGCADCTANGFTEGGISVFSIK
jgi:hypothetical protein